MSLVSILSTITPGAIMEWFAWCNYMLVRKEFPTTGHPNVFSVNLPSLFLLDNALLVRFCFPFLIYLFAVMGIRLCIGLCMQAVQKPWANAWTCKTCTLLNWNEKACLLAPEILEPSYLAAKPIIILPCRRAGLYHWCFGITWQPGQIATYFCRPQDCQGKAALANRLLPEAEFTFWLRYNPLQALQDLASCLLTGHLP